MLNLLDRLVTHHESKTSSLLFGASFGSTAVLTLFKVTGQLSISWTLIAVYASYLIYTGLLAVLLIIALIYLKYKENHE